MFYDDHGYSRAIQEYESRIDEEGCICEPKVIRTFKNEDGIDDGEMNCDLCDCQECEHWTEHN